MNTRTNIDVFVYIQEPESQYSGTEILDQISELPGVLKAGFNQNLRKLFDVEYNPEQTTGHKILKFVRNKGLTGYLVGM